MVEIISRDDYIRRTQIPPDHGMFRYPHGISEAEKLRIRIREYNRLADNDTRAEMAGREYDRLLAIGEVCPPTRTEELIRAARGHPDNASTQAARRLCEKRGIAWGETDV